LALKKPYKLRFFKVTCLREWFKIKTIVPSVVDHINYDQAELGYIIIKEADEMFKLYLKCGSCEHVAGEPLACNIFFKNYCRSCIRILIDAKKLVKEKSNFQKKKK